MSQPNVWIIDHRDSFTWNLAELVRRTGMAVPRVVSNESPELEQAVQAGEKLILSPGPGTVEDDCHRATFRLLERLPRLLRCWAYAWGIRFWACASEPVWNTFPGPFTERGNSYAERNSVPSWRDCRNNFPPRFTIPGVLPPSPGRRS